MIKVLEEKLYVKAIPEKGNFFLAGDIGGTNSNFGVLEISDKIPVLILSLHVKSKTVENYTSLVQMLCNYIKETYAITFKDACLGCAGIISENRTFCKPTNLEIIINAVEIKKITSLESILLINDFEAVAAGIDLIDPKSIIIIHKGKPKPGMHKASIGAGTGLGKVVLVWNSYFEKYVPCASEGGHADCVAYTSFEIELFKFIQQERTVECPISWENVLSGVGIQSIYKFLATQNSYPNTQWSKEIEQHNFEPDKISYYGKQNDQHCKDTFTLYTQFYARCAKNFVLEALALNGMYIAGGIAAKNISLFSEPFFLEEFQKCGKHSEVLKDVPLYVIADYNVSLYGAWGFFQLYTAKIL
jgi:glucokinase